MPDLAGLSLFARGQLRDGEQEAYAGQVRQLAEMLERTGNVRAWQLGMQVALIDHLAKQTLLGSGRKLRKAEKERIADVVKVQTAYLARFADEVALRRLIGEPLSTTTIAQRAALYAGAGRAAWFRGSEADADRHVVYDYLSRDDGHTCTPCVQAEERGPYLPGVGPMPGEACWGTYRCRCRRAARIDKKMAKQLRKDSHGLD